LKTQDNKIKGNLNKASEDDIKQVIITNVKNERENFNKARGRYYIQRAIFEKFEPVIDKFEKAIQESEDLELIMNGDGPEGENFEIEKLEEKYNKTKEEFYFSRERYQSEQKIFEKFFPITEKLEKSYNATEITLEELETFDREESRGINRRKDFNNEREILYEAIKEIDNERERFFTARNKYDEYYDYMMIYDILLHSNKMRSSIQDSCKHCLDVTFLKLKDSITELESYSQLQNSLLKKNYKNLITKMFFITRVRMRSFRCS